MKRLPESQKCQVESNGKEEKMSMWKIKLTTPDSGV